MLLSAIVMSFSGLIVRLMENANAWQINIYRNMAFIFILLFIYAFKSRNIKFLKSLRLSWATLFLSLSLATTGITIVQALSTTTVANTMFVMAAVPFISMILAYIFLGEKISKTTFICVVVAILGIVIMFINGEGNSSLFGNTMAVIAAISFSTFAVLVRANSNTEMLPALVYAALIVVVVSTFFARNDLGISQYDLILCIIWGIGLSGLSHLVFIYAAKYIKTAELTLFGLFESALAPFWVWLIVSEDPGAFALIGGIIVIAAISYKTIYELR